MIFQSTTEKFNQLNKTIAIKLITPHLNQLINTAKLLSKKEFRGKTREGMWKVDVSTLPDNHNVLVTFTYKQLVVKCLDLDDEKFSHVVITFNNKHHRFMVFCEDDKCKILSKDIKGLDEITKSIRLAIEFIKNHNKPGGTLHDRSITLEKQLEYELNTYHKLNKDLNIDSRFIQYLKGIFL